jgi:acyl-CoA thioester hydrolase
VARQEIEYLQAMPHLREPALVEMWMGRIGGASLEVCYEITGAPDGERVVYVRAATTIVLLDAATGQPRRVTADERAALDPYLGEPVQWRRARTDG